MSPFLFGFRQVSLEILHSEKDWAAIVLSTSHVRGLWQQMFGHACAHARVYVCVCVCVGLQLILNLFQFPSSTKLQSSLTDVYFSNGMVMALLIDTR